MKNELLNTQAAAAWLDKSVPGNSPSYWRSTLINNRRNDRSPVHKVPFVTIGRGAFYTQDALQAFAEFEKGRRLGSIKLSARAAEALHAFGIGHGGTMKGRVWKEAGVTLQVDDDGSVFLQLVINEPLTVYRLDPKQAIEFGNELVATGQAGLRHAS